MDEAHCFINAAWQSCASGTTRYRQVKPVKCKSKKRFQSILNIDILSY